MKQSFSERVLASERLLRGPKSLEWKDEFWGTKFFGLRKSRIPKIEGVIEEFGVYGNRDDDTQHYCLVRYARWDPAPERKRWKEIVNEALTVSVSIFRLDQMDALEVLLIRMNELSFPLLDTQLQTLNPTLYQMRYKRSNQTHFEASWVSEEAVFQPHTIYFDNAWEMLNMPEQTRLVSPPTEIWA